MAVCKKKELQVLVVCDEQEVVEEEEDTEEVVELGEAVELSLNSVVGVVNPNNNEN